MAPPEVPNESSTNPAHRIEEIDRYSRYILHSRTEILVVLRTLIQKGALITVHFEHGKSFLLTSMLALTEDSENFILDIGASAEMNRKAVLADKFVLTALIDKVKIQFATDKLISTQHEGRAAFLGKVPDHLLRLQRREFYRLSTPMANPVYMNTVLHRPDGSAFSADIPLFDISGGGVGLMAPQEIAQFLETGALLPECRIDLPEEGLLVANLAVRNKFDVTTRSGGLFVRAGCEFVDTPPSRLNMVQRYIIRIERERKARLSGFG